jgi:hypothetical protein
LFVLKVFQKIFPDVFRAVERSGDGKGLLFVPWRYLIPFIAMPKASEVFPETNADERVLEVRHWLKTKGVRDFEAVSLFCDQLTKVSLICIFGSFIQWPSIAQETVAGIEALADEFTKNKSQFKRAIVKGIPRQAVLRPAHALYRLQNQYYTIGDRVTMIQDSGGVPLSVKGVVIGLHAKSMDVVWDVPFMSGGTLGGR